MMAAMDTAAITQEKDFNPTRGTTDAQEAAAQEVIDAMRAVDPGVHLEKARTPVADHSGVKLLAVFQVVDSGTYAMSSEKEANQDPAQRASINRLIFNRGVVYPKGQELQRLIKDYPYIVRVWAGEIAEMSGAFKGTEREKA